MIKRLQRWLIVATLLLGLPQVMPGFSAYAQEETSGDDAGGETQSGSTRRGVIYIIDNDAYNIGWCAPGSAEPDTNEWRNSCFAYWAWGHTDLWHYQDSGAPVFDEDGNIKLFDAWYDITPGGYGYRPRLEYSGYAVNIDGKDYPIYKGVVEGKHFKTFKGTEWMWVDGAGKTYDNNGFNSIGDTEDCYMPITGIKFTRENDQSHVEAREGGEWQFRDGNCFLFYGEKQGLFASNFDPATDARCHKVTDEELASHNGKNYTVYFSGQGRGGDVQYWDEEAQDWRYYPDNADWDPTCPQTHIHVWGPRGDMAPWTLGGHCQRMHEFYPDGEDRPGQPYYFDNGMGYNYYSSPAYVYEFTYFGGDPYGIKFTQRATTDEDETCKHCGNSVHAAGMGKHDDFLECQGDFFDKALYQFSYAGKVLPIKDVKFYKNGFKNNYAIELYNPNEFVEKSVYFIDTDNWIWLSEGQTPDMYTYWPEPEWQNQGSEEEPDWVVTNQVQPSESHYPSYTGLHGEIPGFGQGSYVVRNVQMEHPEYTGYQRGQYGDFLYDENGMNRLYGKARYYVNVFGNNYKDRNSYNSVLTEENGVWGSMRISMGNPSVDFPWGEPVRNLRIDYDAEKPYVEFTKINGKWYPIYKLIFDVRPDVTSVEFNRGGTPRSTAFRELKEGAVYYYEGAEMPTPILNYEDLEIRTARTLAEIPVNEAEVGKPATIYVNLGANKLLQTGCWERPYWVAYKRNGLDNVHRPIIGYSWNEQQQYWETEKEPSTGWSNQEYSDVSYNNYPRENMYVFGMPKYVNPNSPEYKGSDLQQHELIPVDGHPGVYKFTVDDVTKYNDFACFYYAFGTHDVLDVVSENRFYEYLEEDLCENGKANEFREFTSSYNNTDANGRYYATKEYTTQTYINQYQWENRILARKTNYAPLSMNTIMKILMTDGEYKDEDGEPTKIEVTEQEALRGASSWSYVQNNSLFDEWVYFRINHGGDYHPDDCEETGYKYYKARLDKSTFDSKRYLPRATDDQYLYEAHGGMDSNLLNFEGYDYPEAEGWIPLYSLIYEPGYSVYEISEGRREVNDTPGISTPNSNGTTFFYDYPASRSRWHDPTTWDKYVYDIGEDCLHQSYLTPEEYLALPTIPVEGAPDEATNNFKEIYLAGNEVVTGKPEWDLRNMVKIASEKGVFFHDFSNVTPGKPAEFKISTVNVADYADKMEKKYFDGFYNYQRGWATFNLGLIGPHIKANDPDWYGKYVMDGQPTRKVRVRTDETYNFDTYTQYSWRIEVWNEDDENMWNGMKPGNYYFVIDFLPGERTVTLLDFDPHPHPNFSNVNIRTLDVLSDDQARQLHENGKNYAYIPGSEHSGAAHHNKVNVISADIEFNDTKMEEINYQGYDVAYTIYVDGNLAYFQNEFEYTDALGNQVDASEVTNEALVKGDVLKRPKKLSVDFLDISDEASIAVRGRYVYKDGLKFSSKLRSEDVSSLLPQLNAPQVPTITDHTSGKGVRAIIVGDRKDQQATMAAAATITYTANPSYGTNYDEDGNATQVQLHSFPGYKVNSLVMGGDSINLDELKHPLIHFGHPIMTDSPVAWTKYLGHDLTGESTIEMDEPHYWHPEHPELEDINNWAGYVMKGCSMPVVVENIGGIVGWDEIPDYSQESEMVVSAVTSYPFLVRDFGRYIVTLPDDFYNVDIPEVKPEDELPAEKRMRAIMRAEGETETEVPDQTGRDDIDANGVPTNLGFYKISVSQRAAAATVDLPSELIATGLREIAADVAGPAVDAEYYNLQGIRVDGNKLTRGVYIEKRGNETRKVMF